MFLYFLKFNVSITFWRPPAPIRTWRRQTWIIKKINQLQAAKENIDAYVADLKIILKFFQAMTAVSQAEVDQLKSEIIRANLAAWKVYEYQEAMRNEAFSFSIKSFTISNLIVT